MNRYELNDQPTYGTPVITVCRSKFALEQFDVRKIEHSVIIIVKLNAVR
jgi:hypothetical protein